MEVIKFSNIELAKRVSNLELIVKVQGEAINGLLDNVQELSGILLELKKFEKQKEIENGEKK